MDRDDGTWAIQARGLGRRYGSRWAVRDLDLSLARGRVLGLLGPNGAGKTTTVRMLTGLLVPTEGSARVAGFDVKADRERLGEVMGVTFEQQNLYERLTVRQNLEFFADLSHCPRLRVDEVLEEASLAHRAGDVVSCLSRGQRQRVALMRALLTRPQVLFLDEPTAGLDPAAARDVRRWLGRLVSDGTALLLTTHDMEEAHQLCHTVAIIHQGTLVAADTPDALVATVAPPRLVMWVEGEHGEGTVEVVLPAEPAEAAREVARLQAHARVTGFSHRASTLEDVFLRLTGHALEAREADGGNPVGNVE